MLRRPLVLTLIASGLGVVLALVVAELALRLLGLSYPAFYQVDGLRGYGLRPGARGWWTREGRGWVRINAAGFRHGELAPAAPPPGRLRIAVLGDSFSEALQVNEPITWAQQLQARLQASADCPLRKGLGDGVEVLNFGVGGYGTGQQLLTWRHQASAYRPRLVLLLLYPGNDFTDNEPTARADRPVFRLTADGRLEEDQSFRRTLSYRWRTSLPGRLVDGLMNHSRVLQLLNETKNRLAALRRMQGRPTDATSRIPLTPAASDSAWAVTKALLSQLDREVRASGARLVVVSASSPDQLWPKRQERPEDPFSQERRLGALLQAAAIPYLPLAPQLQSRADPYGQLLHGFPGQEPGQGHWNATGHRLAAEAIANWLCRP